MRTFMVNAAGLVVAVSLGVGFAGHASAAEATHPVPVVYDTDQCGTGPVYAFQGVSVLGEDLVGVPGVVC